MVGETISHYKILEKIGQGGMGEVYLAQDTKLDRKVALKFLPEEMQQDSTARKRFLREAKSAAALDHPYICHIHEVGEVEGKSFISMEYIQGTTLKEKLAEGPLPVKEALEKATEIAEALEAAHKQEIVHRDLKPSNIMLTPEGHVKVMDFGLAKRVTPVEGQEEEITTKLTQQGSTLGTVPYMSPEQVRGQVVDTRSDIFSFGAVLYEMLTGVNPFKKGSAMDMAHAILDETPPPLTRYTENIPVLLQHTVKKMLAKEPDRRYQLIHDVRIDLGEAMDDIVVSSTSRSGTDSMAGTPREMATAEGQRSWQRLAPWLVVCAVLSAVVASFLVWNVKPPAQPAQGSVTRFKMELPPTQRLTQLGNHVVAFSPDGQHLVYAANDQLYLRAMDQLDANLIPGTDDGQARGPFFSPDGQWVGFGAGGQLKKVLISGGTPVTLCETGGLWGASWGVDEWIVFGAAPGIFRVSAAGGAKELLIGVDRDKGEEAYGPQILPGGDAILFTLWTGRDWDDAQIVVQSLETGERKVLINGGRNARYVRTGHLVYARGESLFAVPFNPGQLEVTGGQVPILEGVKAVVNTVTGGTAPPAHFSFSDLGSLVYVPDTVRGTYQANPLDRLYGSTGSLTLVWVDREGQEEPLSMEPGVYFDPRISPDGSRVALTVVDADNWDVWIYDLGRQMANRLTFDPAVEQRPAWTLDGRRVVFGSDRGGEASNLFWKAADGTGEAERLTTSPNDQRAHFWVDGKTLVFEEGDPETRQDLHLLSLEGEPTSRPLLKTQFTEDRPALSPDGRWIAYRSNESRQSEIYVRPFPNVEEGKWLISRDGGISPVWGPDGRELFYRSLNEEAMMIVRIETEPVFTYETPEVLFTGSYFRSRNRNYDISPDGQRFLMLKEVEQTEEASATTQNALIIVQNWFEELKRLVPIDD